MKSSNILDAMLVVCLFLAPAVWAQAPALANQGVSSDVSSPSTAIVPRLIKFSGTLLDAENRPMTGPLGVTFALYAQQTGSAALWMETQNVKPDAEGHYTVLLGAGSANSVLTELFNTGEARWLGVQVETQREHPDPERPALVARSPVRCRRAIARTTAPGDPRCDHGRRHGEQARQIRYEHRHHQLADLRQWHECRHWQHEPGGQAGRERERDLPRLPGTACNGNSDSHAGLQFPAVRFVRFVV